MMANWSPPVPLNQEPAEIMDPNKLFRTRYHYAVSHSDGIARFAYRVIPYSLLRSFCLTFDPTTKFQIGVRRISPITRSRVRSNSSAIQDRKRNTTRSTTTFTWSYNNFTCERTSPPLQSSTPFTSSTALTSQGKKQETVRDTTRSTRPIGSDHGEFEKFKYAIFSPDRKIYQENVTQSRTVTACPLVGISDSEIRRTSQTVGGAAIFDTTAINNLRTSSINELVPLMQKKVADMVPSTVPMSRRYNLMRSVAELKDLPRTVASLQQGVRAISQAISSAPRSTRDAFGKLDLPRNVPDQWLSYWFGWRLLYQDLVGLLLVPERISKEVNNLIERRGKPTTFRSRRKEAGIVTTSPSFTYDSLTHASTGIIETLEGQETIHSRDHEFRLVLNATFDFPEVGVPKLRDDLYLKKLGLDTSRYLTLGLSPTDMYNLVPWSWLVDWFTGLGNYVELIDVINTDPSLFNWGFLTGITNGKIVHSYRTRTESTYTMSGTGIPSPVTQTVRHQFVHSSVLEYQTQVRKDIVNAYGVKSTMELNSLNSYQSSIISAIVATRSRF